MLDNPGDELYFGEVYRQVLQEAWLPEGAAQWSRLGKSRRGRRPTQQGQGAQSPAVSQTRVRICFALCAENWRELLLTYPANHPCYGVPGKQYWYDQKQEKGITCSAYDLYMRICLSGCIPLGCPEPWLACFAWDPESTAETIHEYWAGIYVIGGTPPFEWSVNDPPFWLQAVITTIRKNGITTRVDDCGIANITVTDYCGRHVSGVVTTPDVPWPYLPPTWSDENPEEIEQDSSIAVNIIDGVPPFIWQVSNDHFSLAYEKTDDRSNTLFSSPTACGTAEFTITDCLGTQCKADILCTEGEWIIYGYSTRGEPADPQKCGTYSGSPSCTPFNYNQYQGGERWWIVAIGCYYDVAGGPCGLGSVGWDLQPGYKDIWKDPPCGSPSSCGGTCTGLCTDKPCKGCYAGGCYYYKWSCQE